MTWLWLGRSIADTVGSFQLRVTLAYVICCCFGAARSQVSSEFAHNATIVLFRFHAEFVFESYLFITVQRILVQTTA